MQPALDDHDTLREVRPKVRALLAASPGFAKLSDEERRELAKTMVKVCAYMTNPDGLAKQALDGEVDGVPTPIAAPVTQAAAPSLARAQDDAADIAGKRAASSPGFAGKDFKAGAVKQGVEQFGELVKKVDFPHFVSGLIQNVFQAIVDSSIQQMRAYGELLANVAKTVDQFAQDNITQNNARDWLAQKYPDKLGIDTSGADSSFDATTPAPAPQPKLVVTADDQDGALKSISQDLGLEKPIGDISDETQELALVTAARLQIARSRQQMLASMVVLGINRIVVTDGLIHAKVVFDMRASDVAGRQSKASLYDSQELSTKTDVSASFGGWFSPYSGSINSDVTTDHVTTVQSSLDETSESKAEIKANLTGEVRVNFKSDYFPMEKLATPQMMAAIQGNATPKDTPAKPAAGAQPAPAAAKT